MMLLLLLPLLWDGSLSLEWTLKVQPLVTVQEGMCAHIPCSFNFPSSYVHDKIYGSWFREGLHGGQGSAVVTNDPDENVNEQNRGRFHLLGDPRKHNCSLSITDAQLTDTGKYYFRFRGPDSYSFTDNKLYVNVTALIQKPDISIPEKLESGNSVILNCTFPWACGGDRSPRFSWKGAALSSQQEDPEASHSSEVSFILGPQHHGTNITCQVTFPGGRLSTERTIQLKVIYVPKMFNPTCSWGKEGLFCTCAGQAEPAPSVGWWIEGKFVEGNSSSNTFQVMSIKSGSWTNSSLNVKVQPGHNLIPYCEVRPQHKEDSFSVQLMPVFSTQENSSWPLIITLLRGALIAVGFLLTYSITWLYYTRKPLGGCVH
ncbi:sialic acid-binding Ig-like lectin 14 isoform X2 [Macrotis lagotis]|uniref:sialic acid-binding Ig-like lectin 14 isoform X2 n=1 Tax=Macrotis lagotis TaxID=92651 RepID=UPI003D69E873